MRGWGIVKSLSDLGNRNEKWINLDQIFMVLRRIVELFNEEPWKYGQIYPFCSRLLPKSDRLLVALQEHTGQKDNQGDQDNSPAAGQVKVV
jgi:hypothetical protein